MDSSGMNIANSLAKITGEVTNIDNNLRVVSTLVNSFVGSQGYDDEPAEINVANDLIEKMSTALEDVCLSLDKIIHTLD